MSEKSSGKLVVISGPSGVGKSTIVREVLRRTGASFSVSATTRLARDGEQDGREYFFLDRKNFEDLIRDGKVLEWAEVFGELYGTPSEAVLADVKDGKTVILEIDIQGGLQIAQKELGAIFILILPPDERELYSRLSGRNSESASQVAERLNAANKEIEAARESGVYNHVVINDDLSQATERVVEIIKEQGKND